MATMLYMKNEIHPRKIATALGWFLHCAYSKFYIDESILFITKKNIVSIMFLVPGLHGSTAILFDGTMNQLPTLPMWFRQDQRIPRAASFQQYALAFISGVIGPCIVIHLLLDH